MHNRLYLVANRWINYRWSEIGEDTDLRPGYRDSAAGKQGLAVDYSAIRYFPDCIEPNYLLVAGINLDKNELLLSPLTWEPEKTYSVRRISMWPSAGGRTYPSNVGGKTIMPEMVVPQEVKTRYIAWL